MNKPECFNQRPFKHDLMNVFWAGATNEANQHTIVRWCRICGSLVIFEDPKACFAETGIQNTLPPKILFEEAGIVENIITKV